MKAKERGKVGAIEVGDGDAKISAVYFHQNRVSGKAKNRGFADGGMATNKEQDQRAV